MDSVSDKEVKGIWDRVKQYIDVDSIKSDTAEGIAKEVEQKMRGAGEEKKKKGSMKSLLDYGFPKRISRVERILKEIPSYEAVKVPVPKPVRVTRRRMPKVESRPGKRVAVITATRTKIFSEKNIKISTATWKNKPAYWVYNTKEKKLVTWGLVK